MAITTDTSPDEQRSLDEIRTRLGAAFPEIDAAAIDDAVGAAHRRFDGGRIRDFVPLFVEREASARLSEQFTHA
ncbi:MAG: hypothetical protein WBQ44_13920 [Rhodococcus sp. (in: high G+C Gram-positive bacteria)]